MTFDLLIRDVRVIDGCSNPWFRADVGVKDGRVAAIGDLSAAPPPSRVIEGRGLVASPGFIDIHTHSDFSLLLDGTAQSKIRQGVTLELTNHCGGWAAPLVGASMDDARKHVVRYDPTFEIDWTDMPGFLARMERGGTSVNVAALVGHGAVRGAVFGYEDRPPAADELATMLRHIQESMEAGAFGMSTGIYYAPGSYASLDELAECCRVVARYGGIHASHIRDESTYNIGLLASMEEIVEIARRSGVKTQYVHVKCLGPGVWGLSGEIISRLEAARAAGIDITCDQYPYTASGSSITGSLVPRWAQVGGRAGLVARLRNPGERARMKKGIEENYVRRGGPDRLVVALYPEDQRFEGKPMSEVSRILGVDPAEAAMMLLEQADASFVSHVINEDDLEAFMRYNPVMVGSDGSSLAVNGPLSIGWPHPRNFGTFPRVLARYVRERRTISLPDAVRKMTSLPAQRLGIWDRGVLREGYWADITVFNPDTVQDNATFENPLAYPSGIEYVIVNGEVVIDGGEHTGRKPGMVLRRGT
jgi:N-acyl-D-amino-acid deacylase